MSTPRDDKTAWYWYQKIVEFENSGLRPHEFCKTNKLPLKAFTDYKFALYNISKTDNEQYLKRKEAYNQYKNTGLEVGEYCKKTGNNITQLRAWKSHFNFLEQIERIKQEKQGESQIKEQSPPHKQKYPEKEPMTFIEAPPIVSSPVHVYPDPKPPETIEKQNDLEITINKGIKVIISPQIDAIKIIKIIELLKDF